MKERETGLPKFTLRELFVIRRLSCCMATEMNTTSCYSSFNVYKQLGLGTDLHDLITDDRIHSMGAMYVDDLGMYMWKDAITDPF